MFKKLKEKIIDWTKKISEKSVKKDEEDDSKIKKTRDKTIKDKSEKKVEKEKRLEEPIEIEKTEEKIGFFKKIISNKIKISEDDFENYAEELELLLIENNVALEVSEKIIGELKKKVIGREILKKELESEIKDCLRDVIGEILLKPFNIIDLINSKVNKPYVILFCGINGSGKTTTIAKIANLLKKNKISCVIAAADTFRAASIEQLKKHGDKLGVKIIASDYGADPASVGFDAIKYAEKNNIKVVLIDTAGRMHTEKNLIKEIEKIARVCNPDLKLFVGESITGNDSIEQIDTFHRAIQIDGIILTKADVDEKGGTVLSLGFITKKPILYLGIGQNYEDLEFFDKNKFIEKLGL